jgi:hypothetical protein
MMKGTGVVHRLEIEMTAQTGEVVVQYLQVTFERWVSYGQDDGSRSSH